MLQRTLDQLRSSTPPASDARWRQMGLHLAFLAYALTTPLFHRTLWQYAVGVGATVAADLFLQYTREKRVYFPLSAVITSFGFQLLVRTEHAWVYAVLGAAAMAGKNLVRFRGRHVFNPSNAIIVACALFAPASLLLVTADWDGTLWGLALAFAIGVVVIRYAGRLAVVAGYSAAFIAGAWVLHAALGRPLLECLSPMWSPMFPIFAFFMITDPRTSPGGRAEGALFGLLLGATEMFLRAGGALYAPFYALFVMTIAEAAFPRTFGVPQAAPAYAAR